MSGSDLEKTVALEKAEPGIETSNDLYDPDAGLTAEQRAAEVRVPPHVSEGLGLLSPLTMYKGAEASVEAGYEAAAMGMSW